MVIYAIQANGVILEGRYPLWEQAVEAAQEDEQLPEGGDWKIVMQDKAGNWHPAPPNGVEFFIR